MKTKQYLLPLVLSASLFSGAALAQSDTAPATSSQTEVEVRNEAPAAQAPAAPKIDIDMPKAPDVNVSMPGGTNTETHTERSSSNTTIIDDANDAEPATSNSLWLYVLFGVLAIGLLAMLVSAGSRRTTVTSGRRGTTIIDD